eukprot:scaffold117483_cov46-Phaeocystis_antarctica.AAC.1
MEKAWSPIDTSEAAFERQAREAGLVEGGTPDRLDGRAQLERAREVRVLRQEANWDVLQACPVGELPARLRATRSARTLLQPRKKSCGGDDGDGGDEGGGGEGDGVVTAARAATVESR